MRSGKKLRACCFLPDEMVSCVVTRACVQRGLVSSSGQQWCLAERAIESAVISQAQSARAAASEFARIDAKIRDRALAAVDSLGAPQAPARAPTAAPTDAIRRRPCSRRPRLASCCSHNQAARAPSATSPPARASRPPRLSWPSRRWQRTRARRSRCPKTARSPTCSRQRTAQRSRASLSPSALHRPLRRCADLLLLSSTSRLQKRGRKGSSLGSLRSCTCFELVCCVWTAQAKKVGSYIVRVSFGTTLLISVAVVYSVRLVRPTRVRLVVQTLTFGGPDLNKTFAPPRAGDLRPPQLKVRQRRPPPVLRGRAPVRHVL